MWDPLQEIKMQKSDLDGFMKTVLFLLLIDTEKGNADIHQCRRELTHAYENEFNWSMNMITEVFRNSK